MILDLELMEPISNDDISDQKLSLQLWKALKVSYDIS